MPDNNTKLTLTTLAALAGGTAILWFFIRKFKFTWKSPVEPFEPISSQALQPNVEFVPEKQQDQISHKPSYDTTTITQTPLIDSKKLLDYLRFVYGITRCSVEQLSGYDDLNFKIKVLEVGEQASEFLKEHVGNYFVVKFMNPLEAANEDLLDGQRELMKRISTFNAVPTVESPSTPHGEQVSYLDDKPIPCPQLVQTVDAEDWEYVEMIPGVILPLRMFTFLPGTMLQSIGYDDDVFILLGMLLGKFHTLTATFDHPAYNGHFHFMSFENWPAIQEEFELLCEMGYLTDWEHLEPCEDVFATVEEIFINQRDQFEEGIIHSDFNETNILLIRDPDGTPRITGLLDFGDTHRSLKIFDIAALVLYITLDSQKNFEWENVYDKVIQGYRYFQPQYTVTEKQQYNVLQAMRGRLVMSLIYGLRTARINYRNEDMSYVLKTQKDGWDLLVKLSDEVING